MPMPTLSFRSSMVAHGGDAVAEQHVAAGIVRHRGAVVGEACDVVVVEPDAVRGDEIGPEQAQVLQVRGRRLAVFLQADDHLRLGFLHVRVQADAEFARQLGAAAHEFVAAMVRDGRRDRGPDQLAIEAPVRQHVAHGREARLVGRQPQPLDLLLQRRRKHVEQARDRLVEGEVGDHRRHDRAHAGVGVGLGAGAEALGGRLRELDGQVVAGGAALHQHLERRRCRWRDTCPRPCGCR